MPPTTELHSALFSSQSRSQGYVHAFLLNSLVSPSLPICVAVSAAVPRLLFFVQFLGFCFCTLMEQKSVAGSKENINNVKHVVFPTIRV